MGRHSKTSPKVLTGVEISDLAAEGKALARVDGKVVFVPWAAPGDVVDIQLTRRQKNFQEGKVLHFHHRSVNRVEPSCVHFGVCGGCKWQHIPYAAQVAFKQRQVVDALERIARVPFPPVEPILAAGNEFFYRNKLEYTFSSRPWMEFHENGQSPESDGLALGFHIPGWFDKILDIRHCWLQPDPSNEIRLAAREIAIAQGLSFFDQHSQTGFLRNLMIRNTRLGEWMVVVAFGYDDSPAIHAFLSALGNRFPHLASLMFFVNTKKNDSFFDLDILPFAGKSFIMEQLGHLRCKIGPKSFFQTNPEQALILYQTAREFARLSGNELVYDLYTGTGTIANFVAGNARRVVGIETIPEAIADAWENAALNDLPNVDFHVGNIEDVLLPSFLESHGVPEVIILDPPRAGLHPKVVKMLNDFPVDRIVYVSCNPATQARDVALLHPAYSVTRVRPVDMFPQTHHVENVILLEKA